MKIKLIFRGELSSGVSREQAIERVAALVKQTSDAVERKLFTGDTVTVKTVSSQEDADRFVAAFAKAGVVLDIQALSDSVVQQASTDDAKVGEEEPPSSTAGSSNRSSLRIAGIALGAVLIAVAAGATWYLQPVWRTSGTSDALAAAARALATEDLVALGHVDVKRTVELQQRLFGEPDPGALISAGGDMWSNLANAGIDLGEQFGEVLMALHVEFDHADWTVVALGTPDTDAIRQWISAQYDVERFDAESGTVYFTWLDEQTCEPVGLRAARIGPTRVLVTSADRIDAIWSRLEQDTPPTAPIVDDWLLLTAEQLLTFGVFNPESIGKAADGIAGMMLTVAGQAAAPADGVYFGVAPTLMPPGVDLLGTIVSGDQAFLDQAHSAASLWLDSAQASAEETSPDLVAMYNRISFARDGQNFQAGVRLDTDIDDEIQKLISALFQPSIQISAQGFDGSTPVEEQIQESPQHFGSASTERIRPFSQFGDSFFEPQWQQGPFAITVSKLSVDEQGTLLVSLRGEGRGLPNLGERSKLVRFRVTDVVDESGASVLPKLDCGPIRNSEWQEDNLVSQGTHFQGTDIVYYPTVAFEKHLKLAQTADAATVKAIRGEIEFFLPTQVRSIKVESPAVGDVVEGPGVRLSFKAGSDSSISYQVSGDTRRLLAVRGLNDRGQILGSGSASWSEDLFGSGESSSLDFYGQVAAAEVVLADKIEPVRYTFELPGAYPNVQTREQSPTPQISMATPESLSAAMRSTPPEVTFDYRQPMSTTTAGPALVALQRMDASQFFGLLTQLDLYVPADFPLEHQLNGATVILDQALFADGAAVDLGLSAPGSFKPDGGFWMNGEYQYDEDRPWLKGSASLKAEEYDFDTPEAISGRIVFRSVQNTAELEVSTSPGSRLNEQGVDLIITEWRENHLTAQILDGAQRIVSISALDADGNPAGRADALGESAEGIEVSVDLTAVPDTLRVLVALETAEFESPFILTTAQ